MDHQQHEKILKSISDNNYDLLEQYIQEGKDFRFLKTMIYDDEEGLRLACKKGYLAIVKLLVKNNANIHIDDDNPLQLACENGHEEVVKFLIANNANIQSYDYRAMRRAIQRGHLSIVRILCEHPNLDIHFDDDVFYRSAYGYKKKDICTYLATKGANIESVEQFKFIESIEKNNLEEIKYWILNGMNINVFNGKAISTCVEQFNKEIIWYFLKMKPSFENYDYFVELLMGKACQEGDKDIVDYLFENFSCNIWLPNKLKQYMYIAIKKGNLSIVEILETKGMKISSEDLTYALTHHQLLIAQFFIEKGIELTKQNLAGNVAIREEITHWFKSKKLSESLERNLENKEIQNKHKI